MSSFHESDPPTATDVCADCGEVIRLLHGYWVDSLYPEIGSGIVALDFASMCENGDIHHPTNPWSES